MDADGAFPLTEKQAADLWRRISHGEQTASLIQVERPQVILALPANERRILRKRVTRLETRSSWMESGPSLNNPDLA